VDDLLLSVKDVSAKYVKRPVIEGISFSIKDKQIIAILGHNGAGKTTLLRSIFGLHDVSEGIIEFDGKIINKNSASQNVRQGMAYVAQGHNVFATLTVLENLELGLYQLKDVSKEEKKSRIDSIFEMFPILRERSKQLAGTMSGGQQQMLAIGIALMSRPKLLLLDEPSTGLAPVLVQQVLESVQRVNKEMGTSVILVEQNVREALRSTEQAIVIKRGKVIHEGSSRDLIDNKSLWQLF
jgi:branched-chain amino acid transport system ATP-binding protein